MTRIDEIVLDHLSLIFMARDQTQYGYPLDLYSDQDALPDLVTIELPVISNEPNVCEPQEVCTFIVLSC